jgi:hypothetical protein
MARDVLLSTVVGSRAWGMQRPDSDTDRFVVHAAPILQVLAGEDYSTVDQFQTETEDITFYELKTVCDQIIKGNPNFIIGVLAPEATYQDDTGQKLRNITRANLAKNIYPGIRGMVTGGVKRYKLSNLDPTSPMAVKKCGQMLRFLDFGCRVLQGQTKLFEAIPEEYCTIQNVELGLKMLDDEYAKSNIKSVPTAADFKFLLMNKRRQQCVKSPYINKALQPTNPETFI